MDKRIVIGIDPGLADTGMVATAGLRIVDVGHITTKGRGGDPTFADVMARGSAVALEARVFVEEIAVAFESDHPPVIVIEGYEDFGGRHLRGARNRWTTPAVAALLYAGIVGCGEVVWQSPGVVMADYGYAKRFWKAKQRGLLEGEDRLTNDHLRSAGAHVLAYLDAERRRRMKP